MKLFSLAHDAMSEFVQAVWVDISSELTLVALFCLGFFTFRLTTVRHVSLVHRRPKHIAVDPVVDNDTSQNVAPSFHAKQLEANWSAGRVDLVLDTWPSLDRFTPGAVRAVVEALFASGRSGEVGDALRAILRTDRSMYSAEAMSAALAALPLDAPWEAREEVQTIFGDSVDMKLQTDNARFHLDRVRKALQQKHIEKALGAFTELIACGHIAPVPCVTSVVRLARELQPTADALALLPRVVLCPSVLAALLDQAAKASDTRLISDVHERSMTDQVSLLPTSREMLLRTFTVVGDSRAIDQFDMLLQRDCKPSEASLAHIFSLCAESKFVQLADHIVTSLRENHERLTLTSYVALLRVYCQSREFQKACDLRESMQQDGVWPNSVAFGSLIRAAVESGNTDLAQSLFVESGNPDIPNYMSLIRAAGRERNLPKAMELLEQLEISPLGAHGLVYNCVLEACVLCEDLSAAENLLQRMQTAGCINIVSYNTFIKILLKFGLDGRIRTTLQQMHRQGLNPNAVTYNSLVKAAVSKQDLQGAWHVIHDMEKDGINPDASTCSILMGGIRHAPAAEEIDKVIELIRRANVELDDILTRCLLDVCVRLRDNKRLFEVLGQLRVGKVVPSLHTYSLLIKAFGHAKRLDQAWMLWQEAVTGHDGPCEELFVSMVEACMANDDPQGAGAAFREAGAHLVAYPRAPVLLSTVAKAFCKAGTPMSAVCLIQDISAGFIAPAATYNTVIGALVRQGDLTAAGRLFREMSLKGISPNLITYSTIIKGHCSNGDLEHGLQMMSIMRRRGIVPDLVLFNSVLDWCAKKKMVVVTERVLADMEAAGITPSNHTLSILVKLYGREGDIDAAQRVVDAYAEKYGIQLNAHVYTSLMAACIASGSTSDGQAGMAKALGVYDRMSLNGCTKDAKTYLTMLGGCVRHTDAMTVVRLLDDAFDGAQNDDSQVVRLDGDAMEAALLLAARSGHAARAAVTSSLPRWEAAGLRVSDRVVLALRASNDC